MCILLYVKHIWCSGIPYIYGQLEKGALVYVHSAICETYLVHTSMVNWRMGALVYVHSAVCETSVVQQYTIHLWSIGEG